MTKPKRQDILDMPLAELDALLAERVMGFAVDYTISGKPQMRVQKNLGGAWGKWSPTTNGSDFLEVIDKMRELGYSRDVSTPCEGNSSCAWHKSCDEFWSAGNESEIRATCEAAALAVVEGGDDDV